MDSVPPVHGPARHLDDLLADLGHETDDADATDATDEAAEHEPPPDLPEVVEAVTGRARDLHRLADRLGGDQGDGGDGLSAVALLRAHAGAVGDLAEHLQAAGGEHAAAGPADPEGAERTPATTGADVPAPDDADPAPDGAGGSSAPGPRGVPRSVG